VIVIVEEFDVNPDIAISSDEKMVKVVTESSDRCPNMKLYLSIPEAKALLKHLEVVLERLIHKDNCLGSCENLET
jgi:hypothetical protein